MRVFTFDFDGTLVDSYSCLPKVYELIAERYGLPKNLFVKRAVELEDFYDSVGNFDRKSWWKTLFAEFGVVLGEEEMNDLLRFYWEKRAEMSRVIEGVEEILRFLKNSGKTLVILAGNDGQKSTKRTRVKRSGLAEYFDEILIVGEDVESRVDGVLLIAKKYGVELSEIVFVDDKPSAVNEVKSVLGDVIAVKVEFSGILKTAWEKECRADFFVKSLREFFDYHCGSLVNKLPKDECKRLKPLR